MITSPAAPKPLTMPIRSDQHPEEAIVLSRLRIAMGTWVAIEATAASSDVAAKAIEAAFAAVLEIDRTLHPWRADSDLALLNAAAAGTVVRVRKSTWEVLKLAQRLYEASDGLFDPCVPASPDDPLAARTPADVMCSGRLSDLEFDVERRIKAEVERRTEPDTAIDGVPGVNPTREYSVLCHRAVSLDLGGIAKGFAVDRATEALMSAGCLSGLVNAGGDLRVFGPRSQTIFVKGTADARPLELANCALAVSDADAAHRPSEHRGYYAGGSRKPALTRRYAAVVAKEAAIADALTKCVLLCPVDTTRWLMNTFEATLIA